MVELPVISDPDFASRVLRSPVPVLVEFFSAGCGTCKMLQLTLAEAQEELGERAKVFKMAVETNPASVDAQGVLGVPTTMLFVAGERRAEFCGPRQKEEILEMVRDYLPGMTVRDA